MSAVTMFRRIRSDESGNDDNWLVFDMNSDNVVVLTPTKPVGVLNGVTLYTDDPNARQKLKHLLDEETP